ncbi:MAG: glycosyltransferase family 2 protein [Nitrospirota bacterium]
MSVKDSLISVVIPFYNELESLSILYSELEGVRLKNDLNMEYVFIDDGSTDGSFEKLSSIAIENPNLKLIQLRRNFGKSKALFLGMLECKGDIMVTMDADLQDNPENIIGLIERLNEGFDLVGGWKKNRHDPISKTFPSLIFNWMVRKLTRTGFHDINCGLKAYRRWVIENFTFRGEHHRFSMILSDAIGAKVTEIPVTHRPRRFGKSKFGIERFLRGFLDLITVLLLTRYLERPLHFFSKPGVVFILIGGVIFSMLVAEHLYYLFTGLKEYQLVARPLLIISTILIVAGIQITSIGFILEYFLTVKDSNRNAKAFVNKKINIE